MKLQYGTVTIDDGFWKEAEDLNKTVTIDAVWNRFHDTGRMDALKFNWKPGMDKQPHAYWDSDVFKWLEGACNIVAEGDRSDLMEKIDTIVNDICEHQQPDGYFNTYITVCRPEDRFQDRNLHELYSAGHLFEAAVAHHAATGSTKLLDAAKKFADYIEQVFVKEQSAAFITPGHQEIELALAKLFAVTGEERYVKLAEFFLKHRGVNDKDAWIDGHKYAAQDYANPEDLDTAIGHAVRCLYMLSGMADCAKNTKNQKLLEACVKTYEDITKTKMYITGGTGSTRFGESFTYSYDLSNEGAYAETCAAIALMMFSNRLCTMLHEAKYADTVERAMYNGMMSGISLDGASFFYENPLQITLQQRTKPAILDGREKMAIVQRKKVFDCSCCPPNLNRTLSAMEQYIYSVEGKTVYINQFVPSTLKADGMVIQQQTEYPWKGKVVIHAEGVEALYIRIPAWCKNYSFSCDYTEEKGYAKICGQSTVTFDMEMESVLMGANPHIEACAGKAAVQRGPIVYCAEGIDFGDDLSLLYLSNIENATVTYDSFFRGNTITVGGWKAIADSGLYQPKADSFEKTEVKLIPYYGFANRGESDMRVWINYKEMNS